MRLQRIIILVLILAGFALRLHYLVTTHPFFDEYTTVLAARQILRQGWPILPSGLFYEHGLLATYLITPFTALFIDMPLAQWQPAHWGLMLSRWPSLLLGTATIPLIYTLGRRGFNFSTPHSHLAAYISLLAAGLFAFSPEGMVWGGRARMYALATLLVLLTIYWAYRGALYPAPAKYRWWAMLTLLATLLTQLGALTLMPPLVIGMAVVGWLSLHTTHQAPGNTQADRHGRAAIRSRVGPNAPPHASRLTSHASRVWFLRPPVFLEGLALTIIVGLSIYVKRLGRPIGFAPLNDPGSGHLLEELFNTATYQIAFHFTWPDTIEFLAEQFGVPHHFWLTIATLIGIIIGLIFWLTGSIRNKKLEIRGEKSISCFPLFLWLVFGFIILEMITLLEPFRRNPRYTIMYLPLFYLIAANAILNFKLVFHLVSHFTFHVSRFTHYVPRFISPTIVVIILIALFTAIGFEDLRVALITPEPAYEEALAFVHTHWQPGDALLTMNTPAAGLYLNQVDGFTVQNDAEQFLLNADTAPIDRWLGVLWLGTVADFNTALNASERAWFVIDTIRQPVYFKGDWLAVVNNQMEQLWAKDNALVFRTRPDRVPLPTRPDTLINATLADSIQLVGYTLADSKLKTENSELRLTLFWQPFAFLPADYTVFLHLRNRDGVTVAQRDRQPLDGVYPTSHWQPGEVVIDPIILSLPEDLPAGNYALFSGLYQLDTLKRLPLANDTSGENAVFLGKISLP
jgi:hypothetical protein